ncbi:hypothetical protein E1160_04210 [Rhodospirillaceae bacterium RKSG073]|nr:hypothetical protein [Curvivirga aplysinae]
MKAHSIKIAGAALLAGITMASTSYAVERVKSVSLNILSPVPTITLENKSNNKHISKLDVKPTTSSMNIKLDGSILCKKNHSMYFSAVYYGLVNVNGSNADISMTLHNDEVAVSHGEEGGIIEYAPATTFNIPLSKIKNGHPSIKFDPLAYLESKANAFVNGGGDEIDFYKQDRTYTVQVPISLLGGCWKNSNYSKKQYKQALKLASVKIKYEGDAALKDGPLVNVQLGQNQNPKFDNSNQPLILNKADFQNNIPHYIGKCIPDQNPSIRVNYRGAGKGKIRFKIGDAPNFVIYNSNEINYNSADQLNRHFDFEYPLISKMNQQQFKWWKTVNKTYTHKLTVRAQVKNDGSEAWSSWKDYDTVDFNHRCTPQVTVPLGSNGGGLNYQDGNDTKPKLTVKKPTTTSRSQTEPKKLQVQPIKPVPAIDQKKPQRARVQPKRCAVGTDCSNAN